MPQENDFSQWLPHEPRAAYYSSEPFGAGPSAASPFGGGYSPAAQQYWSGQYGNVMNQYEGELGRAMRLGQEPPMSFHDYLGKYPWTERYSSLSPRLRPGGTTSRLAPLVRRFY